MERDAEQTLRHSGFTAVDLRETGLILLRWAWRNGFLHPWISTSSNKGGLRLVLNHPDHAAFSLISYWVEGTPPGNANEPVMQIHVAPDRRFTPPDGTLLRWHDLSQVGYDPFMVGLPDTLYWARGCLRRIIERVMGDQLESNAEAAELRVSHLRDAHRLQRLLDGIEDELLKP